MACVKTVSRSASVALSPTAQLLAAGTMAGAVDLSFSSSANIEIFSLDFQSDDRELPLVGEAPCSERFNRLAWGNNGSGSEQFSLGLIAGGLVDGNIDIWNPLALINHEAAHVGHLSMHKGPVRGLEFSSIKPNLLASGADEGEIAIWDLATPAEPIHFPALKGTGSAAQTEISFLSWNGMVQNILAATSYNGTTAIWDLNKQKPVIQFSDSNRRRCSTLQWNPDIATQLVVASDDDSSPFIRLWDMRNYVSPVKEFVGHNKGVIGMSWCPNDSTYLLTCAKDNRTICWDTNSGEIVCELPAGNNWNFDVHWYPKIPGIISASSFDGNIGIYNIEGCSRYGAGENVFSSAPLKAPKWYKRPVGVSFGFGGKLVSFNPRSSGVSEIFVHSMVTEDKLASRSSEFEVAIRNGMRSSLRVLCEKKLKESESADDRETWGFLKVMFEDDGTARTKLLTHLGFSLPTEAKDTVEGNLSQEVNARGIEDKTADTAGYVGDSESTLFPNNAEDFFNNLPSPKADTPTSTSGDNFVIGSTTVLGGEQQMQQELDGHGESADPSFDVRVLRAMVVGDFKAAVAQCISANKLSDALLIAHVGGSSLLENTRDQCLKMSRSPYLKVVAAMVNNDFLSFVDARPLELWQDTLAFLCSFAQGEEWTLLCDKLASKLMAAGNTMAATLCYMCAGNIDKTVEIWSRSLTAEHEGKSYVDLLQDLMEKTIVLALATGQKRFSASLCKLVEKYTEILASQGLLTTALEYLKFLGSDDLSPEILILRDRIALSTEDEKEVAKTMGFENSQASGDAYGVDQPNFGMVDGPQPYYQGTTPSQIQQTVPGSSPYGESYPQPGFGSGGYGGPSPYQPAMFLPSQANQGNFGPPPATSQPAVRPFIPSTPAVLRNVEQYQQPTLGSQLYPGSNNPSYQGGPPGVGAFGGPMPSQVPGHKMPHVVAPTPTLNGFMPVNNSNINNPGIGPRPGMGSMQPASPPHLAPVQPAVAPAVPQPTVPTADTSNVPAHQRSVITTLTRLFHETSEAMGGARANPGKKREIEDNSRKIGALFAKLNTGDISKNAGDKLVQLCQALDNGDFNTALQIQLLLTTSEWDECNFWLVPLKRMIKTRQSVRLS